MFDQKRRIGYSTLAALLALLLVLGVAEFLGGRAEASGPGEPDPGTVVGVTTWEMYPATALSGAATAYSVNPSWQTVRSFNSMDVFVTVDITGTGTLTVTPQVSTDNVNWVNATYNYVANTLAQTTSSSTSVVTGTSGMTATTTTTSTVSSSGSPTEATYQIVLSADGTDYLRMPVMGEYVRFSIAYSGTMTPTVNATLRNN